MINYATNAVREISRRAAAAARDGLLFARVHIDRAVVGGFSIQADAAAGHSRTALAVCARSFFPGRSAAVSAYHFGGELAGLLGTVAVKRCSHWKGSLRVAGFPLLLSSG